MKVIRCENGHYYDSDLFSRCPHCREPESGSGSGKKQGRQISFFQAFRKESKPSAAPEDPIGSEQNAGPDATGGADGQGRAETVCEPTEILSKEEIELLLAELDGQNGKAFSQKGIADGKKGGVYGKHGEDYCPSGEADGKADEASSNNCEADSQSREEFSQKGESVGKGSEASQVKKTPVSLRERGKAAAYRRHDESGQCEDDIAKSVSKEQSFAKEESETVSEPSEQKSVPVKEINAGTSYQAASMTDDAAAPIGDAVPPTEDAIPATDDTCSPTVWVRGGEETTDRRPVAGWLVGIAGPCFGRSFEILRGRNSVGRSEANDISIKNDKRVSREKHMNIVYDPSGHGYYIEPGDSRGLVYCNGRIILAPTAVTGSDLIEIGGGRYVIQPLCGDYFPEPDA